MVENEYLVNLVIFFFFFFFFTLFVTFGDLHVRNLANFADLHSYAYCSFVLLNEAITIASGSHCGHAL